MKREKKMWKAIALYNITPEQKIKFYWEELSDKHANVARIVLFLFLLSPFLGYFSFNRLKFLLTAYQKINDTLTIIMAIANNNRWEKKVVNCCKWCSYLGLLRDCHQFEMWPKRQDLHGKIRYTHAAADPANALDSNVDARNLAQSGTLAQPLTMDSDWLESQLVLLNIWKLIFFLFEFNWNMENDSFFLLF